MHEPHVPSFTEQDYSTLYKLRFSGLDPAVRLATWAEITAYLEREFFPAAQPKTVLDLGAGDGEFINHVSAAHQRIAVDMSDRIRAKIKPGVTAVVGTLDTALATGALARKPDVVFLSNFLEHLSSWAHVQHTLRQIFAAMNPGGKVIILGPNYRYVGPSYWDFADHVVPLTEQTIAEHGQWAGFEVHKCYPRFLPYTFKSRLPTHRLLVRAYLRFPLAWRLLGKQFLLVLQKPTKSVAKNGDGGH